MPGVCDQPLASALTLSQAGRGPRATFKGSKPILASCFQDR